jgi:hypothetical protein
VLISDFDSGIEHLRRRFECHPVAVRGGEIPPLEFFGVAYNHPVPSRVQFKNIQWASRCDSQPAPLSHGKEFYPVVVTKHATVCGDDFAPVLLNEARPNKETTIVVVGHKADFLALLSFCGGEFEVPSECSDIVFLKCTQRENGTS